jgi:hypothetical protein
MRFLGITFVTLATVATMVADGARESASASSWTQYGHDSGHSFANPQEGLLGPAVVKGDFLRREVELGLLDTGDPLVWNGSLFTTSHAWDGENGRLARFDLATGEQVWRRDLSCFSRPVLSEAWVLIQDSCSQSDPPPVGAVSIADGSFSFFLEDYFGVVKGGTAYLSNLGRGVNQEPWELIAQSVSTKSIRWRRTTSSYDDVLRPVLAAGSTLYVQHNDAIEARDTATGHLLWLRTPASPVDPVAAIRGSLFVRWQRGDRTGVARWDSRDGVTRWRSPDIVGPISVAPDVLYGVTVDGLVARSTRDGSRVWKHHGWPWAGLGQPVYADGVVWGLNGADLEAFDAATGRQIAFEASAPAEAPTIADGQVFVPTPDGRVYIYAPAG